MKAKKLSENLALVKKGENYVQSKGWNLVASSKRKGGKELIKQELESFGLHNIPYLPHLIISKDGLSFIVMLFWKEKYPFTKGGRKYTGIDWYKYQLLQEIEAKTHMLVGLIMYSSQENRMIFRQMNQLGKPDLWFRDYCLVKANKLNKPFECQNCFKQYPEICERCITGKKGKAMAIWSVDEFETGFTVQPKLLW
jgi:hypothetical protein